MERAPLARGIAIVFDPFSVFVDRAETIVLACALGVFVGDDGRVISNFIRQALAGEPLTIYGDGAQTRSFCFVDDLVEGLIRMMDGDQTGPVNLGNPSEVTIGETAETIRRLTGSSSEIVHVELPEDDPKRRCPDITRARDWLNWEPTTDLENGLGRTIDSFRDPATETEAGA